MESVEFHFQVTIFVLTFSRFSRCTESCLNVHSFFHFCLLKSFSRLRSCLPGNHSTYQGSRGPVLAVACGANPKTAFLHFRETTGSDFTHEPMLCCHASSGHGHGFIFQVTIIIFNVHITLYQVAMPWSNHACTIAYVDYVQLGGIMNNCSKYFLCLHIFYFDIFPRSGIVGPEGICLFVTQCFPSGILIYTSPESPAGDGFSVVWAGGITGFLLHISKHRWTLFQLSFHLLGKMLPPYFNFFKTEESWMFF